MDGWSRCRKPVGDTWWEINTVEAGGGGSVRVGLYRLFVLAVAVWEGAGCKVQGARWCCDGQRATGVDGVNEEAVREAEPPVAANRLYKTQRTQQACKYTG
ncbi:hypothetical protein HBI25_227060 [Parastagonospora nodorum]|nr:hypothetical protein HBH53_223600 [Parastagonospora nodorum]KAH4085897.1 hypothetical protein HBH46_208120 [Parastagonospora nodorum]KAH4189527.1 hypothetical protein HBI95_223290 [Parastagonospora nodorum]KAH4251481.1 hypothetical protein HBI03_224790 [Parastagonospora nodorum]KAH4256292.1 hypothetical protein HBI04_229780 [Parastagonospora nodorum]